MEFQEKIMERSGLGDETGLSDGIVAMKVLLHPPSMQCLLLHMQFLLQACCRAHHVQACQSQPSHKSACMRCLVLPHCAMLLQDGVPCPSLRSCRQMGAVLAVGGPVCMCRGAAYCCRVHHVQAYPSSPAVTYGPRSDC